MNKVSIKENKDSSYDRNGGHNLKSEIFCRKCTAVETLELPFDFGFGKLDEERTT